MNKKIIIIFCFNKVYQLHHNNLKYFFIKDLFKIRENSNIGILNKIE